MSCSATTMTRKLPVAAAPKVHPAPPLPPTTAFLHHHLPRQVDHLDVSVSSLEETEEEETGDTFPDDFKLDSSIIERPPPDHAALSTKIRRKFSSTILRNNEAPESCGTTTTTSRSSSADVGGSTIEALPKGRRRGLSLTASLQRLFYADGGEPTPPATTRSDPLPLWRASAECLYGFIRRGQNAPQGSQSEWDFICQGEAPVVPPRSDQDDDEHHKLVYSSTSWTSDDYGFELCSPASSPTSINTFSTSTLPSSVEPCNLSSSSPLPLGARHSCRPTKVLIEDISAPFLSLSSHRSTCANHQPIPSTPLASNHSALSGIEISNE